MGIFTRGPSTLTQVESQTITAPLAQLDEGDHERFAHYVRKEKIVESAVTGKAVTALCGKRWIPSRDPERFPICPTCKEIHAGIRKGPDDGQPNSNQGSNPPAAE